MDETLFQRLLHLADSGFSDDPYGSDHFRMFEFKVRPCSRSRTHNWTDCPFAHPGEKARRRDPRKFSYSAIVCSDHRNGGCSKGDTCEYAHGVFECWLHPDKYKTEACKDGKNCKRKVCFFAHSGRELRPSPGPYSVSSSCLTRCCNYCNSVNSSATSNLLDNLSLNDLISSLEAMKVKECFEEEFVVSPAARSSSGLRDCYSGDSSGWKRVSKLNEDGWAYSDPDMGWDIGWVDDLVM